MSARKLLMTVDCGATTCGKCREFFADSPFYFMQPNVCTLFHRSLVLKRRLPECLHAEKEAKRV